MDTSENSHFRPNLYEDLQQCIFVCNASGIRDSRNILYISIDNICVTLHCKKRLAVFPSPAGMSLTKLSLARNNLLINLFPAMESLVSDIPDEDAIAIIFFTVCLYFYVFF